MAMFLERILSNALMAILKNILKWLRFKVLSNCSDFMFRKGSVIMVKL